MPEPVPPPIPQTLPMSQKYCHACAAVLDVRSEVCPRCGVRQFGTGALTMATTPSGKNRIAAALFAFFLGGLGVHKFYLGQIGLGIVYLLFCWTFVPSIIGVIEAILLFTQTDAAFAARYG